MSQSAQTTKHFKQSVVYQIYPKSFQDSNGDGLGDLKGVISRLDYLQTLGVDYIWLTPFFISPQNDNGYDVADYLKIDPSYGTMEDFETLAQEAQKRGINLMLDMVFNHTSTEHEWFKKALAGDPKYQDYYIFKDPKTDGRAPTNWESKFGGNAWEYVPSLNKYYLHLFDKTQADLNWENPQVRQEVQAIVRFWMEKGVKGFRFDVINLISKSTYEDDFTGDGRRFYTDGPKIHEFLQELNANSFGKAPDIVTVGEMSSTSLENCYKYANEEGTELSMVFSFHHLKVDFMGNDKWVIVPTDFAKLKDIMFTWQEGMAKYKAWNAVFWCNHDQPRVVSRFGDEGQYHVQSAKMLANVIHCLRGTPYIYQGEELGMTNANFNQLEQYKDVESINHYHILRRKGLSHESVMNILKIHSRDNSRTPMQWTSEANGGFTTGTPWIAVNPNTQTINAQAQIEDSHSIFAHYQALIKLRKEYAVIAFGEIKPLDQQHDQVFAYERTLDQESLICINNFYGFECDYHCAQDLQGYQVLLSNYDNFDVNNHTLRPYESVILYKKG